MSSSAEILSEIERPTRERAEETFARLRDAFGASIIGAIITDAEARATAELGFVPCPADHVTVFATNGAPCAKCGADV